MYEASCRYCELGIEDDNYLDCIKCRRSVHIKCLPHASTPGDLLGDVFFDFTCVRCVREQLKKEEEEPAPDSVKEICGLGHHGFFHWRTHIISFVDKNWNYIFGSNIRRKKQWTGTVSGALSHNNPEYFQSGLDVFKDHGWWKLAKPFTTPRSVLREYEKKQLQRQQLRVEKRFPALDENSCSSEISVTDHTEDKFRISTNDNEWGSRGEGCARLIPFMGRQPRVLGLASPESQQPVAVPPVPVPETRNTEYQGEEESEATQQPLSSVQASLMDFLAESLGGDDLSIFGSLPGIMPPPLVGAGKSDFFMNDTLLEAPTPTEGLFDFGIPSSIDEAKGGKLIKEEQNDPEPKDQEDEKIEDDGGEDEDEESSNYQPRIVQVTNYQAQQQNQTIKAEPMEEEVEDETEKEELYSIEPCLPSGFSRNPRRNWPWLQETQDSDDVSIPSENLRLMSVQEEQKLLDTLHRILSFEKQCQISIPAYVRRLYRKLSLRKWKREHNRPIFNLDDHIDPLGRARLKSQSHKVLDRYHLLAHSHQSARSSFHARLAGCTQYELFESPYSKRVLHPFIFRSETLAPPWLKLMCELQHRVNQTHPTRSTIDFCYVRPQHIPAVNALLQSSFWPNIDVSECLTYPDYSVVALYKKLVVGCGFLVPDVGYNEAYISFMAVRPNWQRSRIASFMLYHLIQTCSSKDITLHVSASNSAVMLYQKFGFKIEEIILDFYDTYLPLDSKQSRNAFFLRLQR
ncbi:cysteine-rich protein 2-binding protein isoform X2 [Drosophila bipectinata]|uniref:cysteine-rich protein 2-binding protein isoform X2 n=1 Tax=Drosophila bipectinata TaxID=42026 RepID=UPI0038B2B2E6